MDKETQNLLIDQANTLKQRLSSFTLRVQDKYDYFNADQDVYDFGISVPKKMMNNRPGVGWASRAVTTLADRVTFDGFGNDRFGVNDLFSNIGAFSILNKAKNDAFIAGVSFVAISQNEVIPFSALEATGLLDQKTGLLKMGFAVTRWQFPRPNTKKNGSPGSVPADYIIFTPNYTALFVDQRPVSVEPNATRRCLLQPITHRSSVEHPLGKSRISKTARRIIQEVARVKRRYEIAGEFYSTPQRYLLGTEQGLSAEEKAKFDSALGKLWAISKDDDGDKPEIGQLAQMSINQFEENKKGLARDFCAETGLTLRNLGYETANPTSAESLTAMSDDLLLEAQHSQTEMGEQFKQLAITQQMLRAGTNVIPTGLTDLVPAWKPIFQLDVGAAGDAVYKLIQVMPELAGTIQAYQMLGIGVRDAEKLQASRKAAGNAQFMIGANNGK